LSATILKDAQKDPRPQMFSANHPSERKRKYFLFLIASAVILTIVASFHLVAVQQLVSLVALIALRPSGLPRHCSCNPCSASTVPRTPCGAARFWYHACS